jgi:hypothetical protein
LLTVVGLLDVDAMLGQSEAEVIHGEDDSVPVLLNVSVCDLRILAFFPDTKRQRKPSQSWKEDTKTIDGLKQLQVRIEVRASRTHGRNNSPLPPRAGLGQRLSHSRATWHTGTHRARGPR